MDPLHSDPPEKMGAPAHGSIRLFLDHKSQPGRKTQSPHDAQGVLLKSVLRISHSPQNAGRQIRLSTEGIHQRSVQPQSHGIDSEITASQILHQRACELHMLRVTAVQIFSIPSVSRDLNSTAASDSDSTVLQSGGKGIGRKKCHHSFRQSVGGHIPVPRLPAQQCVAHSAAHTPRLVSRGIEPLDDLLYLFRYSCHSPTSRFMINKSL